MPPLGLSRTSLDLRSLNLRAQRNRLKPKGTLKCKPVKEQPGRASCLVEVWNETREGWEVYWYDASLNSVSVGCVGHADAALLQPGVAGFRIFAIGHVLGLGSLTPRA